MGLRECEVADVLSQHGISISPYIVAMVVGPSANEPSAECRFRVPLFDALMEGPETRTIERRPPWQE